MQVRGISMAKRENISASVVRRLPRYYRFLRELDKQGVSHVSSSELANKMGSTASQVRQDLNCFGGFGHQGIGYSVAQLRDEIENILGIKCLYPAILVGAGNIGTAIANQVISENRCIDLIGIFDKDPRRIGTVIGGITVDDTQAIERFCRERQVVTAIICVPKSAVEEISQRLYNCGIHSFWNFSHFDISDKFPDVVVENVHLSESLMELCFKITQRTGENDL